MPTRPPIHKPFVVRTPKHNARGKAATNRQKKRAHHTGSKAWKAQRFRILVRDLYTCQGCGGFGDQVDHINNDAEVEVEDAALQVLCISCHSSKTLREQNRTR